MGASMQILHKSSVDSFSTAETVVMWLKVHLGFGMGILCMCLTWTIVHVLPQTLHTFEQFAFLTASFEVDPVQHENFLQLLHR